MKKNHITKQISTLSKLKAIHQRQTSKHKPLSNPNPKTSNKGNPMTDPSSSGIHSPDLKEKLNARGLDDFALGFNRLDARTAFWSWRTPI